jgi:hypothetical protein
MVSEGGSRGSCERRVLDAEIEGRPGRQRRSGGGGASRVRVLDVAPVPLQRGGDGGRRRGRAGDRRGVVPRRCVRGTEPAESGLSPEAGGRQGQESGAGLSEGRTGRGRATRRLRASAGRESKPGRRGRAGLAGTRPQRAPEQCEPEGGEHGGDVGRRPRDARQSCDKPRRRGRGRGKFTRTTSGSIRNNPAAGAGGGLGQNSNVWPRATNPAKPSARASGRGPSW